MNNFYLNKEFEGIYPPEAAIWCNEQGNCRIEKISTEPLMFKIVENPEPEAPSYQELRAAEYPDCRDYLDAQVKINSGNEEMAAEGQAQLETYYEKCLTVKNKYPKP